jgi:hypothetical protein
MASEGGALSLDEELRSSLKLSFDHAAFAAWSKLPPPDEGHVAVWRRWAEEGGGSGPGIFAVLERHLPQLRFPIREGISQEADYRAAVLQGSDPAGLAAATGLLLEEPGAIGLELYPSVAGTIPLLIVKRRPEFVALVRALGKKNEPAPIPDSMGALMIAGYNNWHRVGELRRAYEEQDPRQREPTWREAFARIKNSPDLYQDRFILLSDGPYSAVPAAELGLADDEWRRKSLILRRDHECAHYATRRLFGSMKNHLHDELIADYAGIVAAEGRFRADWFLRFVGLDGESPRPGARALIYRCVPPLSDAAFEIFCRYVKDAARQVEIFDGQFFGTEERSMADRLAGLVALVSLRLDEMAEPSAPERLAAAAAAVRPSIAERFAA